MTTDATRETIVKAVMGNYRVHFGTYSAVNGDTGGDIKTDLRDVKCFIMDQLTTYTVSNGVVTATILDPGATVAAGWIAIGY